MTVPWRKPTLWELGPELGIDLQVPWVDISDNRHAGGAKGDGTEASDAIISAIGSGSGQTVRIPRGTYQISKAITVPGGTRIHLDAGAVLNITATGGVDVFTPGGGATGGASITGDGFGGSQAQIVVKSTANINRVIAPTSNMEFCYVSGLNISCENGATVAGPLIDFTSVFANSFVRDTVLTCNSVAPNGVRYTSTASTGYGPVFLDNVWVQAPTQHGIFITENNPTAGACYANMHRITVQSQGSGFHGVYVKGYGGIQRASLTDYHYESSGSVGATSAAVCVDTCNLFRMDGAEILSGNITNRRGVWIVASVGSHLRNIHNPNLINPIVQDDASSRTIAGLNVIEYTGKTAGGNLSSMLNHTPNFNEGITTKIAGGAISDGAFLQTPADGTLAVDSLNNKIYVRIGGTWKSVTVA